MRVKLFWRGHNLSCYTTLCYFYGTHCAIIDLIMLAKAKKEKKDALKTIIDVVGIEVGVDLDFGTPIVRVRRGHDGVFEILAAGFLHSATPIPERALSEKEKKPSLVLPKLFHATAAAFAITSAEVVVRQCGRVDDALEDKEKGAYRAGVFSEEGEGLSLVVGVPEYVCAWAAGLLPEGKRPTACSIQVSRLACINAFAVSACFSATNGTALLLLVDKRATAIVIFQEYKAILYREHSIGSDDIAEALCRDMNLDRATVEKLVDDNLVDPTSALEPALGPLFRQVELSTDYALRKNGCFIEHFFLYGLTSGAKFWEKIFKSKTGGELVLCNPLEGFRWSDGAAMPEGFDEIASCFVPAVGAAVAVLGDA